MKAESARGGMPTGSVAKTKLKDEAVGRVDDGGAATGNRGKTPELFGK